MTDSSVMLHLLALQTVLVDGERILKEFLLFLDVHGLETGGHRCARGTAGVQDVAAVVMLRGIQQGLDTGLGEAPGTGVQRFLLSPDDVLGVGVAVEVLLELSPGEGVQLLDTGDGGVADVVGLTVLEQCGVHLTRAEDHTFDLLGLVDSGAVSGVGDDPLEVGVASELGELRASNGVTQERLGEEHDQSYKR